MPEQNAWTKCHGKCENHVWCGTTKKERFQNENVVECICVFFLHLIVPLDLCLLWRRFLALCFRNKKIYLKRTWTHTHTLQLWKKHIKHKAISTPGSCIWSLEFTSPRNDSSPCAHSFSHLLRCVSEFCFNCFGFFSICVFCFTCSFFFFVFIFIRLGELSEWMVRRHHTTLALLFHIHSFLSLLLSSSSLSFCVCRFFQFVHSYNVILYHLAVEW